MPPLEPRDHRIKLADAAAHTRRHRATLGKRHAEGDHGGSFHADQVLAILAQKGCVALRLYHGRHEKGGPTMVLLGVDAEGRDLAQGLICEQWLPCPPFCPLDSPLLKD